ncbi:acetyl-CoA carboxylase biotin carboxyl carrier protein [Marivirga sericea]|uniref:Biotin carboxyl carrier protein of acetyl-CoA carboxylase n=1 Tax=Marivirga sericea TaxID=1028 RepID=A0A1X7JL27_9BACT|nr:acetyl-CoA carboxylase biotin carboxyl carrier protein [Marivirga sericea]SMG28634.1 acetyl-CoA carboxylase biotin carboxyl carrier protein [Marivirga sericea]
MKAKEIQDLIDFISKSGLDEVNIETEEFKIKVKKNTEAKVVQAAAPAPQPVAAPAPSAAPAETPAASSGGGEKPAASDDDKYVAIKSPMIGTFYRTPNPDNPAFVNVGDSVKAGDTVCIVEAMKLFNEIESDISGKIVKILVDNATPVEYDQPLFLVDPS